MVKEVWASFDQETNAVYIREHQEPDEMAAVMKRVAKCESGSQQFDKKGVLVKHVNKDGSVDIGLYMINDKRHEAQAVKLGMNIYTEEGNQAYAEHLYATQGTQPWLHSLKCWQK